MQYGQMCSRRVLSTGRSVCLLLQKFYRKSTGDYVGAGGETCQRDRSRTEDFFGLCVSRLQALGGFLRLLVKRGTKDLKGGLAISCCVERASPPRSNVRGARDFLQVSQHRSAA